MREISTERIKIGEHILIDGVEYVGEEGGGCEECPETIGGSTLCALCPICGHIVKKKKEPKLMTNRQLAEWLAKGNGEMSFKKGMGFGAYARNEYEIKKADDSVSDEFLIRPWNSDEWVEPTVDIYERDCR